MCVVCPRDSSAATPHVWLGRRGESLSSLLSSSPLKTASHWPPDAVAMALGCSGNWRAHLLTGRERKL